MGDRLRRPGRRRPDGPGWSPTSTPRGPPSTGTSGRARTCSSTTPRDRWAWPRPAGTSWASAIAPSSTPTTTAGSTWLAANGHVNDEPPSASPTPCPPTSWLGDPRKAGWSTPPDQVGRPVPGLPARPRARRRRPRRRRPGRRPDPRRARGARWPTSTTPRRPTARGHSADLPARRLEASNRDAVGARVKLHRRRPEPRSSPAIWRRAATNPPPTPGCTSASARPTGSTRLEVALALRPGRPPPRPPADGRFLILEGESARVPSPASPRRADRTGQFRSSTSCRSMPAVRPDTRRLPEHQSPFSEERLIGTPAPS